MELLIKFSHMQFVYIASFPFNDWQCLLTFKFYIVLHSVYRASFHPYTTCWSMKSQSWQIGYFVFVPQFFYLHRKVRVQQTYYFSIWSCMVNVFPMLSEMLPFDQKMQIRLCRWSCRTKMANLSAKHNWTLDTICVWVHVPVVTKFKIYKLIYWCFWYFRDGSY